MDLGLSNALRSTLVGCSMILADEVGADGSPSNIVLPDRVSTKPITFLGEKKAAREGRSVEEVRAESLTAIPAARYGDPEEYADVAAVLASARASNITGRMIRSDGGYVSNV